MKQDEAARVVGTATVFLRPLRFMFDVETDVEVMIEDDAKPILPFDAVHVHLRAATKPPLMERDQLLNGFLRADTLIHSCAVPKLDHSSLNDCKMDSADNKDDPSDEDQEGERMLSSLRGTFIWILVRLQPLARDKAVPTPLFTTDLADGKMALRVQYQLSSTSESYCLPIDHTNVVKLLVSDEFIDQVDTKVLQFNFLSISLVTAERLELQPVKPVEPVEPEVKPVPVSSTVCSDAALAALATSEAAVAEEGRRRKRAEEELLEAKAVAQAKDLERLEAQLQAKADAKRAQELELSRSEQVHAKALLEKELATQEQQNQALKETHKQLEDQLRFSNENAQRFQINITSTDQALELLKQRAASDAKEREELQRRLRILEEEKLALQRKSRACTLQ